MNYLTLKEAAAQLGVCRQTMKKVLDRGGIPFFRVNGFKYRIEQKALDAYVAEQSTKARSD